MSSMQKLILSVIVLAVLGLFFEMWMILVVGAIVLAIIFRDPLWDFAHWAATKIFPPKPPKPPPPIKSVDPVDKILP